MNKLKSISFIEGILVAFIVSLTGSVAYLTFSFLLSEDFAVRLLITGLSFLYMLYLLGRSHESIGRPTVVLLWSAMSIILWLLWPPLSLYLIFQLLSIWLIRSIYFYSSLLSVVADLGLTAVSVAIAFWAASHTGSLFLTLWCFFLTQALFVAVPARINSRPGNNKQNMETEADFQRSYRVAEAAVSKLSTYQ